MMSKFTKTLKGAASTSVRVINRAATSVADATRFKLSEMDCVNRRRDAIKELGEKVYGMYQVGMELPEDTLDLLNELRTLDETLAELRANRAAQKEAAAQQRAEERAARKAARQAAREAAKEAKEAEKTENVPVSEEKTVYDGVVPTLEMPVEEEDAAEEEPMTL